MWRQTGIQIVAHYASTVRSKLNRAKEWIMVNDRYYVLQPYYLSTGRRGGRTSFTSSPFRKVRILFFYFYINNYSLNYYFIINNALSVMLNFHFLLPRGIT